MSEAVSEPGQFYLKVDKADWAWRTPLDESVKHLHEVMRVRRQEEAPSQALVVPPEALIDLALALLARVEALESAGPPLAGRVFILEREVKEDRTKVGRVESELRGRVRISEDRLEALEKDMAVAREAIDAPIQMPFGQKWPSQESAVGAQAGVDTHLPDGSRGPDGVKTT
ncbi:MAG: hypothetical protein V2A79_01980 [Planctomycetota bacterium]